MDEAKPGQWTAFLKLDHIVSGVSPFFRPLVWLLQLAVRSDSSRQEDLLLFLVLYGPSLLLSFLHLSNHDILRVVLITLGGAVSFIVFLASVALTNARYNVKVKSWSEPVDCTKPLILPCRTNHARMFPEKHSFGYKYLQVSIPVEFEGKHGLVSVGKSGGWNLFTVNPSNFLQRSCNLSTLRDRLNAYLRSEGVDPRIVHHSYLVTAPRFLGYAFNPVSFWYLYDKNDKLVMMILEVNNTFDERRLYLVKPDPAAAPDEQAERQTRIKDEWKKDFHVSPFNSRKGEYSLSSLNPFSGGKFIPPGVDNNIVLKSSKGHAKLVARLISEEEPINPKNVKARKLALFLAQWCWLGLFTFPRIVKEASLLFFSKRLHVWRRPEVLPESIGRTPTASEVALEPYFRQYLTHLVKKCPKPIALNYDSGLSPPQVLSNIKVINKDTSILSLRIKVTSPAFYSKFVLYTDCKDGFEQEAYTEEKKRTLFISERAALDELLNATASSRTPNSANSFMDSIRWRAVSLLRYGKSKGKAVKSKASRSANGTTRLSDFDRFVIGLPEDTAPYRRSTTRLLLASRVTFGNEGIIHVLDLLLRGGLTYLATVVQSPNVSPIWVHVWAFAKG